MRNFLFLSAIACFLLGCASGQLNYNTLDLAATVDSLVTQQVLENLSKFIDNPAAIPSQVDLAAGSATTANGVTPTFTDPVSAAATTTGTFTTAVAAAVTNTTTRTSTKATSASTFGVSASDTWTQSWTMAPVTAPDDLRRLRALYRYVFHGNKKILRAEYPLIQATKTLTAKWPGGSTECPLGEVRVTDKDDPNYNKLKEFNIDCSESISVPYNDPSFLREPGCVFCSKTVGPALYTSSGGADNKKLFVNERLSSHWLYWRPLPGAQNPYEPELPPDSIFLGNYGHYALYIKNGDQNKLAEFVLFIRESTGLGSTAGGASGSSKGGAAGKAILVTPPAVVVQ